MVSMDNADNAFKDFGGIYAKRPACKGLNVETKTSKMV